VDLVLFIDWTSGRTEVYRRNQGETKFAKVASFDDPAAAKPTTVTTFKQGLYRGPDVNGRTDVLWMGPRPGPRPSPPRSKQPSA